MLRAKALHNVKKVVWFNTGLIQSGGGERLSLETVRALKKQGIEAYYIVFYYDQMSVFDGLYHDSSIIFRHSGKPPERKRYKSHIANLIWLRKMLMQIRPDVVITQGTWGQVSDLFLSNFLTGIPYLVHIFGSIFAFPPSHERSKYALIFREYFFDIRNSLEGYRNTVPDTISRIGLVNRLTMELAAVLKYLAVRNAKRIYVLSKRNQWEVEKLYRRNAIVLKGAYPESIFSHLMKIDVKKRLGIKEKRMVLSVCRFAVNKRVDITIRAFACLLEKMADIVLVIGGTGPEEENLRGIVKHLEIESKVMFVGFIPDEELWDYIGACDVFVSLDLADFDIAPLEALALGKKVVLTGEMELEDNILNTNYVYTSEPIPDKVANCMENALSYCVDDKDKARLAILLSPYTWEQYSSSMLIE